eukprot:gene5927-33500_t
MDYCMGPYTWPEVVGEVIATKTSAREVFSNGLKELPSSSTFVDDSGVYIHSSQSMGRANQRSDSTITSIKLAGTSSHAAGNQQNPASMDSPHIGHAWTMQQQ